MIHKYWLRYTGWLKNKLPEYYELLNPGIPEHGIRNFEDSIGFSLPTEFHTLYQINNGNKRGFGLGAFMGFDFLSLEDVLETHENWKTYENNLVGSSLPEKHIKIQYTNPKWIPIFADFGGNYIAVDLDPDEHGISGQIINIGRDQYEKFVIAESLLGLLKFIASKIESGECDASIIEEDPGVFSYGLRPQSHLIDDLRHFIIDKGEK